MKEALKVLVQLVAEGVIEDYAIGGAMGATFYLEPVVTMDLDVFVLFKDNTSLLPLQPIYDALKKRGYLPDEQMPECIDIGGTPVQFLPVYNHLLAGQRISCVSNRFLPRSGSTEKGLPRYVRNIGLPAQTWGT